MDLNLSQLENGGGHCAGAEVDLPSEENGGGWSRTDANDDGDERRTRPGLGDDWREDMGWAATGTHDVRQNGAKEKKRTGAIDEKKLGVGSTLWVCQV